MLQAGAPAGTLTFDVRCMVALSELARSPDEAARRAAESATLFYFGRIDGRIADTELEASLWRESRGMRADQRPPLLQACGGFMQDRGRRLMEVGNRIAAREGQPARQ